MCRSECVKDVRVRVTHTHLWQRLSLYVGTQCVPLRVCWLSMCVGSQCVSALPLCVCRHCLPVCATQRMLALSVCWHSVCPTQYALEMCAFVSLTHTCGNDSLLHAHPTQRPSLTRTPNSMPLRGSLRVKETHRVRCAR